MAAADELIKEVAENICLIQSIPHTEIIDQVSFIITHAGHGTTSLGLKQHSTDIACGCLQISSLIVNLSQELGAGIMLNG